ncbi:MAG: flavodoxin-dependent (E)-4-hydroxy-3-methylbut-2-enyl-diphosphate synthase [Alphaproteobacteria bacterium]|jgi:(E)-4-hydroxy-3-methylbut-2-enyl-diphosphate synthase|nr:flavodoxin-dependent (E)-4-hydroxy-3-methylbut-2-enyl-diphosphate synthase [Alphaproteobacteria bacterium]|tara:strand:- start:776 stop:1867 length:1092 start_codon:yes stop_codon:yes gene_type:complete
MNIRPYRHIERRKSKKIKVGNISVGGDAPISVQTMTNTPTTDIDLTLDQIEKCVEAGADIIRVSCPDKNSTTALKQLVRLSPIPIVADIHFHYLRAIEAADAGAACLRINPGNIGQTDKIKEVISAAKQNQSSIRIGVNAGSLEKNILDKYGEPTPEALVDSALAHIQILKEHDFQDYKVSVKASDVFLAVAAYTQLADIDDCPLHIGITEAGSLRAGTVKSSIGLGNLLWSGIGDTIRVSLSADPAEEVRVAYELLKSLGLRRRGVTVISCPSCARQQFDVIKTVQEVEERLQHITDPITVSIIGCIVNGPGEAKETDIGLTGGGKGNHQIYVNGITDHIIRNENVADYVVNFVLQKISEKV